MVGVTAFLRRLGVARVTVIGALVLGLLLGTAMAFGLASSDLPFAFSAAHLATSTSTAAQRLPTVPETRVGATGCGATARAAKGQSADDSLTVGDNSRDYRLHIPRTYESDQRTPLLLAFHGHGDTAPSFERYSRLSQLADERGFLVAYPQGERGPDGQPGWNTFRHRDPTTDDIGFVNALVSHLQETLCVDPQRIYATGFSNGGGFTSVLACDLSARIAAFAPVAGDYYPLPGGCHPPRPVSVMEIHGTADTTNPYNGSTQLDYVSVGQWLTGWTTRDACTGGPTQHTQAPGVVIETWDNCQGTTAVVHVRLIGVKHLWLVGPPPSTPNTSQSRAVEFDTATAIWGFLSTQSLPAANAS